MSFSIVELGIWDLGKLGERASRPFDEGWGMSVKCKMQSVKLWDCGIVESSLKEMEHLAPSISGKAPL